MSEISFKKGDRVVHHKGNPYIILGVSNRSSDKQNFPATVTYYREGTDPGDDTNWYSRTLTEFAEKFTVAVPDVTGCITVTLGVFGQVNRNNEIYILNRDAIERRMQAMVGNAVGEMAFPKVSKHETAESWLRRIVTIVPENEAGKLAGYDIIDSPVNEEGQISVITVVGVVRPSPALLNYIDAGNQPHFGIRSLVLPYTKNTTKGDIHHHHITDLVCFDLTPENPRAEMISI